jgi:hypothetical protein
VEECGPCPVFASFAMEFAIQMKKNHRKKSVRVRKTSVKLRKTSLKLRKTSEYSIYITKKPTHYKPPPPHTHTLQNNIKLPQYKLKQTQCKIYPNEIVTI